MTYDVYIVYRGHDFSVLAQVLGRSISSVWRGAEVHLQEIKEEPPDVRRGSDRILPNAVNNAQKLVYWWQFAERAERPFVLMDADMLAINDVADIWDREFEMTYTTRYHRCPVIGGLFFCRPTEGTRSFIRAWCGKALSILMHPKWGHQACLNYGGCCQASINMLLKERLTKTRLLRLDSREWNLCDQNWHLFDWSKTRVVHLKGRLRNQVLHDDEPMDGYDAHLQPFVRHWNRYLRA